MIRSTMTVSVLVQVGLGWNILCRIWGGGTLFEPGEMVPTTEGGMQTPTEFRISMPNSLRSRVLHESKVTLTVDSATI